MNISNTVAGYRCAFPLTQAPLLSVTGTKTQKQATFISHNSFEVLVTIPHLISPANSDGKRKTQRFCSIRFSKPLFLNMKIIPGSNSCDHTPSLIPWRKRGKYRVHWFYGTNLFLQRIEKRTYPPKLKQQNAWMMPKIRLWLLLSKFYSSGRVDNTASLGYGCLSTPK